MGRWTVFFHEISLRIHYEIADDPYYCGLRARVSNFVKNKNTNEKPVKELGTEIKMKMTPHVGTYQAALSHGHPMQTHQMWHSRSFDSGMGNWFWQLFLLHNYERSQRIFYTWVTLRFMVLRCRTESRHYYYLLLFFFYIIIIRLQKTDTNFPFPLVGVHLSFVVSIRTVAILKYKRIEKW